MKIELDDALCRDFPLLYADRSGDNTRSAMCWGFEVPDEWEPIIRELSEKLEVMIEQCAKEDPDPDFGLPRAAQVKEKYGTLRFYMTTQTEQMDEAIRQAEHKVEILNKQSKR